MHSFKEAKKRMERRNKNCVCWTLKNVTIEYKYIPATEARNYDGELAGSNNDPDQIILQGMVWKTGCSPRYSNYW